MTDITFNWTLTGLSVSDGQDGLVGIVRTISWKLEAAHPGNRRSGRDRKTTFARPGDVRRSQNKTSEKRNL